MEITEGKLREIIATASKEGARSAIKELKKQGIKRMDTFKKTEYILKNYNEIRKAVADRKEHISEISQYGIQKKSSSITSYPGGTRKNEDDYEKADMQIEELQQENATTIKLIEKVDSILEELSNEPYFKVIEMYYMQRKKYEVIAGELGVSVATVSAAKRNLVDKIRVRLFTDELIKEIMTY